MENTAHIPGPLTETQLAEFSQAHRSGQLPLNASSAAFETSHVIKKSQGKLYGLSAFNKNAGGQFVYIFDLTAVPANGTAPAMPPFAIATAGNLGLYFGSVGRAFEQGIVVALSTSGTSFTLGGSDLWIDAQYV